MKVSTENRPTLTPGPSAIVDVSIQPPATLCVSGRRANADTGGDRLVTGAGIGGEQNLRPLELARRLLATAQKRPEFGALGMAELHPVAYIHPRLLGSRHGQTAESDGRRESACKNFHAQVGPISGVHLRLYAAASPATDRSRHAALLPRQPTFGAPDDPDAGTRRLHPPAAPRRPQHRNARRPGKSPGPTLTSPTGQNLCAAVLAHPSQ